MRVFHYHLVSSEVRDLEARYIGRLGFELVGRYGRIDENHVTIESGTSWEELDQVGFKLRLAELQRGAVSVVLQPGHWRVPRLDHIGITLDEDDFAAVIERATRWELPIQERGGRRTFVTTNAGYRLEIHPPRDWIDEMLADSDELALAELELRTDRPEHQARILAELLDVDLALNSLEVGTTIIRFVAGGPEGRPELSGERFA